MAGLQYDVFVSHRGPDFKQTLVPWIKKEFGLSRPIFVDNISMDPAAGGMGWEEILAALRSAKIVMIILSPGFQESAYCLEELRIAITEKLNAVRILCYTVEPGHVDEPALQRASHNSPHGTPAKAVEEWTTALKTAGNIKSWVYKRERSDLWIHTAWTFLLFVPLLDSSDIEVDACRPEPELVWDIVRGISRFLPPELQDWEGGKFDIEERVQDTLMQYPLVCFLIGAC